MLERSLVRVKAHWGHLLSCDPSKILAEGFTVANWEGDAVEFLVWEGGAVVGAPEFLQADLNEQIHRIPFDLTRDDARRLVEPIAIVEVVHGPQFVGYCDRSTVDSLENDAERIDQSSLSTLRDACSADEWIRSAVRCGGTARPTFAVLDNGRPISASQISSAHGIAGISTITHPAYRNQGHGKSVVTKAVEFAFNQGLLPEYRTVERWTSSVALAEHIGFQRVARSILVELRQGG